MKLGRTPRDRTLFEQLGDLYSLLVTTDHIEKAFVRDAISDQESVDSGQGQRTHRDSAVAAASRNRSRTQRCAAAVASNQPPQQL